MSYGLIAVGACTGILVLIVTAVMSLSYLRARAAARRLDTAFQGRRPLTYKEFHQHYFAARGIPEFVSIGVRKVLESETRSDLSRLAADDDFHGNLSFLQDAVDHPDTVNTLEKVFEIRISESDVQRMGSAKVEDIVELVWNTLKQNRPKQDPATQYFVEHRKKQEANGRPKA